MFTDVSCLAVFVTDYERAKAFYTDVLKFRVRVELGPDLCFLVSESGRVHIYLEGGYEPACARLGFFLEAAAPIFDTYKTLEAAGVQLLDEGPEQVGDDRYSFRFADPDGNIIEVSCKR